MTAGLVSTRAPAPWGSLKSSWTVMGEAKAPIWDFGVGVGWLVVTTLSTFGFLSPLRYGLAGYCVLALFLHWRRLLPIAGKHCIFFAIPVLDVISSLWSPNPSDAERLGMLMAMTTVGAIFLAGRLNPTQIVRAYLLAEFLAGLLSAAHPNMGDGVAIGVFPQKNVLALHMLILYVVSFIVIRDRTAPKWMKAIAYMGVPLGLGLIVLAKSGTTFGFTAVFTAALLGQVFVWDPARRVAHARSIIVLGVAVLAIAASLVLFGLLEIDPKATLLNALGKDSTLTGRTFLWDEAHRIIREHPWTGMGAHGFWQPWRGTANMITRAFFFERFVGFNFHNSYLELGTQLGYPGMFAAYAMTGWALFCAARRWMANQNLESFFFFGIALMIAIRANTEMDLAGEFGPALILQMVSAMVPLRTPMAPLSQTPEADPELFAGDEPAIA